MTSVRGAAIRLVLYNHKGGVGKTTLTVNIASALAAAGKRVLLVDADPQCNITSYLVETNVVNKWLDESDTESGTTIWSAIKPVAESSGPVKRIKPYWGWTPVRASSCGRRPSRSAVIRSRSRFMNSSASAPVSAW